MKWAVATLSLALWVAACGSEPDRSRAHTPVLTTPTAPPDKVLALPKRPGSVRFAAIGDAGRGHQPQYEVAATMARFRNVFEFSFVVMLGDNVYDGGTAEDYRQKFEAAIQALSGRRRRILCRHREP